MREGKISEIVASTIGEESVDAVEQFDAWARGDGPVVDVRAPARVNLIGEHTDYNEGFVLPVAIDRHVRILGREAPGREVRLYTHTLREEASFSLARPARTPEHRWADYAVGAAALLREAGHELPGMDLMVWSTVPVGSGLSSSAAYTVALLTAFSRLGGFTLEANVAVDLAQRVEWDFAGARTGIMDQTVSLLAHANLALLLDCRSRDWQHIPLNVDAEIVVCFTGVPRQLVRSAYNQRRRECEEAVAALRCALPEIRSLRDVSPETWAELANTVPEPARRRARHVISENARVLEAVEALEAGDLVALAELLAASHQSLRDDYEVSSPELDALVTIAVEVDPGIPSRLTGAGFGGCTVHLVPPGLVDAFEQQVREEYPRHTGRKAVIYRCRSVAGAMPEPVMNF